MPKDTLLLLIRHAEKPEFGPELSPLGQRHAQGYVHFFTNFHLGPKPRNIDALFAAADTDGSIRPRLTLEPLAAELKLPIHTGYEDKQTKKLAEHLLSKKFDAKTVVVCWKHSEILQLAEMLGATAKALRPKTNWPVDWPDSEYHWLLQIAYDAEGRLDHANTYCIRQPGVNY